MSTPISEGWFVLKPGECRVIWKELLDGSDYFAIAADDAGSAWGGGKGGTALCVNAPQDGPAKVNYFYPCVSPQVQKSFLKLDTSTPTVGPFAGQPQNRVWTISGGVAAPTPPPRPQQAGKPESPPPVTADPCHCTKVENVWCVGVCVGSCSKGYHCTMAQDLGFVCVCRPNN